ncbi:MAG: hypothetical protein ACKVVT_03640 [Dehalococcoidia bacterium]
MVTTSMCRVASAEPDQDEEPVNAQTAPIARIEDGRVAERLAGGIRSRFVGASVPVDESVKPNGRPFGRFVGRRERERIAGARGRRPDIASGPALAAAEDGTTAPPAAGTGLHAHRWVIEEPAGPTSTGRCRGCGEERAFWNWVPETDFVTATDYAAGASIAG